MATIRISNNDCYFGTYTFKDDNVGVTPDEWVQVTGVVQTYASIGTHNKVLELDIGATFCTTYNEFSSAKETGTVEFWVYSERVNSLFSMRLQSDATVGAYFCIYQSKFQYNDGIFHDFGLAAIDDTWYRIKLIFDCVTDTYDAYVYNTSDTLLHSDTGLPFLNGIDGVNRLYFLWNGLAGLDVYVDAIGYSWDENYTIGKNVYVYWDITSDIIHCEIQHNERMIPTARIRVKDQTFEEDDIIQVKDYYTSQTVSDDVQFRGEENFEDITTPAEYYKGSGGFNYQTIGDKASLDEIDWVDSHTLYNGEAEIVTWQNHKNILRMLGTVGADPTIDHNITQTTSGTFEMWIGGADTSDQQWYYLYEDATIIILLEIMSDLLRYYDDGDVWQNIQAVADDTLYHIKIYWHLDGADTKFSVWVDGTLQVDDVLANDNQTSGVNKFQWKYRSDVADYGYLDAPGLVGEVDPQAYTYVETYNINPYDIDELLDEGYVLSCAFNGSYIGITSSLGGHEDVLTLYDNQGNIDYGDYLNLTIPFSNQTYGTIELFMRSSDATYENLLWINDGGISLLGFKIDEDKFQYNDGVWKDVGLGASDDTWYHIRIVFECTTGEYESLTQYYWKVFINGVEYGDYTFKNNRPHADDISFRTDDIDNGYTFYIDAVDFSWASNYFTNRNRIKTDTDEVIFEGMIEKQSEGRIQNLRLVSQAEELENIFPNTTYTGNDMFAYSEAVLAEIIDDECSHVTVNIHTGIYRAKYNFEDDTGDPDEWTVDEAGTGTLEMKVDAAVGGHWDVVEFDDDDGANSISMNQSLADIGYGTVEFWYYCDDPTDGFFMELRHGANNVAGVGIDADIFQYIVDATGNYATCGLTETPTASKWYHIRLDFECTAGGYLGLTQYHYLITVHEAGVTASEAQAAEVDFDNDEAHVDTIVFFTSAADSGHLVYIDAIGYSWDLNSEGKQYIVGDNKHLLIDNFDVGANMIDGAAGATHSGNKSLINILIDMCDLETFSWALTPGKALIYRAISTDSFVELGNEDKVWAVTGEKILKRINRVEIVLSDADVRSADDLDAQATYGIRLYRDILYHTSDNTVGDAMAAAILTEKSASPQKIRLWLYSNTYGFIQPLESIEIATDEIYYNRSMDYVPNADYIVQKVRYNPITQIITLEMADGIILVVGPLKGVEKFAENIGEREA